MLVINMMYGIVSLISDFSFFCITLCMLVNIDLHLLLEDGYYTGSNVSLDVLRAFSLHQGAWMVL